VRQHAGDRVQQTIFEPMLRGKFGAYHDQVNMAWLWNKFALRTASRGKGLRGRMKEQLGYPMGSFGDVFDTLAERIAQQGGSVHLRSPVSSVTIEGGRARGMDVRVEGAEPQRFAYDAVLSTTPSFLMQALVPGLPTDYLEQLSRVSYLSAVLIVLELDRPLSRFYWTHVGDRTLPFLGVIEHTNFIPADHYGNNHIVYLTNYLERDDRLYLMGAEELYREYLVHLKRINPAFDESWVRNYHHHKLDAAQPIVTVDYANGIPDHQTPVPGLYLANTTQIYPEDRGTNYSVRIGRRVAALIDEDGRQ
jgi:protoporphyrinogen oxidase